MRYKSGLFTGVCDFMLLQGGSLGETLVTTFYITLVRALTYRYNTNKPYNKCTEKSLEMTSDAPT